MYGMGGPGALNTRLERLTAMPLVRLEWYMWSPFRPGLARNILFLHSEKWRPLGDLRRSSQYLGIFPVAFLLLGVCRDLHAGSHVSNVVVILLRE